MSLAIKWVSGRFWHMALTEWAVKELQSMRFFCLGGGTACLDMCRLPLCLTPESPLPPTFHLPQEQKSMQCNHLTNTCRKMGRKKKKHETKTSSKSTAIVVCPDSWTAVINNLSGRDKERRVYMVRAITKAGNDHLTHLASLQSQRHVPSWAQAHTQSC